MVGSANFLVHRLKMLRGTCLNEVAYTTPLHSIHHLLQDNGIVSPRCMHFLKPLVRVVNLF